VRLLPGIGENFDFDVVRGRKKIAMESISALIPAGGRGKGFFLSTAIQWSIHLNKSVPGFVRDGGGIP